MVVVDVVLVDVDRSNAIAINRRLFGVPPI